MPALLFSSDPGDLAYVAGAYKQFGKEVENAVSIFGGVSVKAKEVPEGDQSRQPPTRGQAP